MDPRLEPPPLGASVDLLGERVDPSVRPDRTALAAVGWPAMADRTPLAATDWAVLPGRVMADKVVS